ncbi:ClpP/crotonase-like domain-containing protein [Polychytrium aggregatum]|uniref:ClpP/crotonase-like domain-containing protein n=1 Tax=Polychytrium aggregatum TaxID=110093 RepID=UPI0022FF1E2E|nr:ClpP/crotonase-like domain-containing protein [Polychytrium aggregatum]KAI9197407.1 ClpP/crotonase-like domain-containing protein [Polychytrium aggregatum]
MSSRVQNLSSVEVLHRKANSSRHFVLNRPTKLNALNLDMVRNITPQLLVWDDSELVKNIVMLPAEGSRAFCAGGDVTGIVSMVKSSNPEVVKEGFNFFKEEYELNHLIGTLKTPFVAVLDGITMGGGVGLSVHAPFRIATEKTLFAMPETSIGLIPDVGGSFFLPRLDGQIGTYLGLTGHRLKGEETVLAGIATHFVPSERIPALLARLSELSTDEIDVINYAIEDFVGDINPELYKTWSLSGEVRRAIDRCFKYDTIEEIVAALEAEASLANTPWAQSTIDTLKGASPLSLGLTLMQLREGKNLDFMSCFAMERRLGEHCIKEGDFVVGVESKLVKKQKEAEWSVRFSELTPERTIKSIAEPLFKKPSSFISRHEHFKFHNSLTFLEYPHRTLTGLPFERDVKRVVEGRGRRSRKEEPPKTKKDVINWFLTNWGAYDARLKGVSSTNLPNEVNIEGGLGRGKIGLFDKVHDCLERYVNEVESPNGGKILVWVD